MNKVILMGRLTRDPELRYTSNQIPVASFTLAVDRKHKSEQKTTDFIDCIAWRTTGEFVSKWFSKGKMIAVEGSLQIRSWEDKEGNKRKTAEVVCDGVYFTGDRGDVRYPTAEEVNANFTEVDEDDEDTLPF